jgi:dTDP-4-dehydrorhamnose reductase
VNAYGFTKFGAEGISEAFGGKTLRLSRTVSVLDNDIHDYLFKLKWGKPAYIPNFQTRNYLHRNFAVDGIEYLVNNWGIQNQLINYAGTDNISMVQLMRLLAKEIGLDTTLIRERGTEESGHAPRPAKGGLNVKLAKKLGFPMFSIKDTVSELVKEFNGYTPTYPVL